MISTTLIFLPKVYILAQGKDIDWNEQKKNAQSENLFQSDSRIATEADTELIEQTTRFLHGKTVDEKYVLAQLQVSWWRQLLMKLEEKRTSSQTSNQSMTSTNSTSIYIKDDDDNKITITAGIEANQD